MHVYSVPSYKKRSYKKRLVDIVRHKKRLYKDTEKIRNTSVQKCLASEKKCLKDMPQTCIFHENGFMPYLIIEN